jgi:hypothetical protein
VEAAVGDDLGTALFGLGWGALFADPAVRGSRVSFVHNMNGYYFLKTGVLGSIAVFFYVFYLLSRPRIRALRNLPWLLAGAGSLIVGLVFQPSYKVLTYGLILLLPLVANFAPRQGQ